MICQPCRSAADYPANHADEDALAVELAQRDQHAQCRGGTHCTCQHRVAEADVRR